MVFEEIMHQIGEMGRFQIFQMTFLIVFLVATYPQIFLETVTAATPDHRCWVPILDNDTVSVNDSMELSPDALLRISIPLDANLRPEKCRRFLHPQWHLLHLNGTFPSVNESSMESCVDGWVYDRSLFHSTIVTQWDLVCESQWLISMTRFIFMIGSLVGGVMYGHFSDRFGRKLILRWCFLQLSISGICVPFAPNFLIYCLLRFLSGFCITTVMINSTILMLEWTVSKFQAMVMSVLFTAFSVGNILLGALGFAIRDWRILQWTLSIPVFLAFVLSRWLMESARWLIITNNLDEGIKLLKKAAHINGKKNIEETLNVTVVRSTMQEELDAAQTQTSIFEIIRSPKLRLRICYLAFVRLASQVCSYGLAFHLQHWGSNVFLLQILLGVVTFLGRFIAIATLTYMGRRINQILFMSMVGLFIMATTLVPQEMQTLRVSLAMLGACASATASISSSLHHVELIPTVLRGTASGINLMAGRCGSALAPLLMILQMFSAPLPWIIYGIFSFLSGFVVVFLPETRNQPLPDTIQDVENKSSRKAEQEETPVKVTQF